MSENKLDLFELGVEISGIAETCSILSWTLDPDGGEARMGISSLRESLDSISRHLSRIANELEN